MTQVERRCVIFDKEKANSLVLYFLLCILVHYFVCMFMYNFYFK